jgi:hypothetical protein
VITRLAHDVTAITCDGRRVDDTLTPRGPACGKTFKRGWKQTPLDEQARAAGWALGPDGTACCPACRKPSREPVDVTAFHTPSTEE